MSQNPDSKLKFDTSPNCKCIFSILCILCVFRVSICTKQGSCSRHWLMLLPATASNITSMLTTPSYVLPCVTTTHPTDWPFSPSVPLTSGSTWYLQNGLQLNPDKSEALMIGTANQLLAVSSTVSSVSLAGVGLPVGLADEMKVLGVVFDWRLTFVKHVMAVARSCNYHAIRHIRHLLSTDLAATLACSLIQSRLDYCNSLLHGASTGSISTYSVRRTMQPGSSCRLRGDRIHGCYCINCQFITELTTSWL